MRALLRLPSARFATGCLVTHRERVAIDASRARAQHEAYADVLESLGVGVELLPALEGHPDAVFVEDAGVALPEVFVLGRPGAPSRRGEPGALRAHLHRDRPVVEIEAPGCLEGGDVIVRGGCVRVGLGGRTDGEGARQLEEALAPFGYRVVTVPVSGALHLRTACTVLDDETVLLDPRHVDPSHFPGFEVLEADPDEPAGASLLVLPGAAGEPVVVGPASAPRTLARLAERGMEVRTVELSEIEKAEGGPTCLSFRIPRASGGGDGPTPNADVRTSGGAP